MFHADTLDLAVARSLEALSAQNEQLEFELKRMLDLREYWERVEAVQHWMDAENEAALCRTGWISKA